ncbi:MFS general substrate transporter [Choiromyces venosus 120613-1]|uniref:MFS general substrate transporter n=1 Tax=Choiromyces venosus 120613-1 TaxID=1336337 RepID=A0A3N4JR78_9PEZI|nr:MFS general substrate transporter [Choiromyces venosus 120613-1]
MVHFYHFNFHSSIGHNGPKRPPKQDPEKKPPKVTIPAIPETASEILGQQTTKSILRRIDLRLVPILSLLYLLCFICRQNIGNAKTYHMTYDLHLTTQEYQIALTAFFLSYSTFDIPCNIMLKKLRPSVWLPLVTLLSGIVTVCMGIVENADELIVVRMFLGMTECGLFPGVAYVITMWYCKKEAQFRQALFFCAASMAGAFAGLLAVGLSKMDGLGGQEGWRWILIVEGLLTAAVAICAFFVVLDTPDRVKFLTKDEKEFLLRRLEVDQFGEEEDELTEAEKALIHTELPKSQIFKSVFTDWHIYAHILVFYGITCPLYSISLCLPSIVYELGYTSTEANFLTVPIYITACMLSLLTAYLSDRTGKRAVFIAISYTIMFTGFLMAALRPGHLPGLAYAGLFIAACGIYPAFPGMITWCSNNLAPSGKRAIAMALHIGMGSFGGAMGANFYRPQDKPLYRLGNWLNLGFVCVGGVAIAVIYYSYHTENKRREGVCAGLVEELEKKIENAGRGTEEGEKLRRDFVVKKEESLALEGDTSVWFRYMM